MRASTIVAMISALLFAGAALAKDENVKLPLKFEKGKSFLFQVQFQPGAGFKAESGRATEPGQAGQPGQSGTDRQNKENQGTQDQDKSSSTAGQPGRTGQLGETAGAMMGPKTANFRFTVQDTSDKETTLNVDLQCADSAAAERSSSAQGAGEMPKSVGTLTVKVDENGNVKDIQGWDRLNWSEIESHAGKAGQAGQPGQEGQSGQPGKQGQSTREGESAVGQTANAGHQQWMRKVIDADLEVIFGAGLHEKNLESGKYYYVRNPSESHHHRTQESGTSPSSGTSSDAGTSSGTSQDKSGSATGGEYGRTADQGQFPAHLNTVLYRFDGSTKETDREYARFSVLIPEKSAPGAKETGAKEPGRDQSTAGATRETGTTGQSDDETLRKAGWRKVGEATYLIKDGLLANLNVDFMGNSKAGFSSPQSQGPSLMIRRLEGTGAAGTSREQERAREHEGTNPNR